MVAPSYLVNQTSKEPKIATHGPWGGVNLPPAYIPWPIPTATHAAGLALSIPKMSLGTKIRVTCPPELAYGEKGLPPKVPGNATVLLEIELLSFETSDSL